MRIMPHAVLSVLTVTTCAPSLLWAAAASPPAPAGDARLLDPESARAPRAKLILEVADSLAARAEQLRVVLDGLDVTALVRREGRRLVIQPVRPLLPGAHRLLLLERAGDTLREQGRWRFRVAVRRGWRGSGRMVLRGKRRSIDHGFDAADLPGADQADGNWRVKLSAKGADWELQGKAAFLYNSLPELTPARRREFDIGKYRLRGRYRGLALDFGHQRLAPSNLVINRFARRGLSGGWRAADGRWSADLFALRTDRVAGFSNFLGFDDPARRTLGGWVRFAPSRVRSERLALTATYLHGKGSGGGLGSVGDGTATEGNVAGVMLESTLRNGRLKLRGELARSRVDLDAGDGLGERVSDDAASVLVKYRPRRAPRWRGKPAETEWGLSYLRIGPSYRSPANIGLATDREALAAVAKLKWGALGARLTAGAEEDNVDDDPLLPTRRKRRLGLQARYRPPAREPAPWYGRPTYKLSINQYRDNTVQSGSDGIEVDSRSREVDWTVVLERARDKGEFGYRYSDQHDFTGADPNTRNQLLRAGWEWQIRERMDLGTRLEYGRFDSNPGDTTENYVAALWTNVRLVPNRLDLTLEYQFNGDRGDQGLTDRDEHSLSWLLNWQAVPARGGRPGLAVWMQGAHQEIDDRGDPSSDGTRFQVFVGATLTWSYQNAYP